MGLLKRSDILSVPDIKTEDVEIPEWGGTVRVRALTASQRDSFESESLTGKGKNREVNLRNIRARLVAKSVVDENGQLEFTDVSDVKALGDKNAAAIDRIYDVASRLSGLSDADVEELGKTSESDRSDA